MRFKVLNLILGAPLLFAGCSGGTDESPRERTSPRVRKQIQAELPKTDVRYHRGDNIPVRVSHRQGVPIDSITVRFGGRTETIYSDDHTLNTSNQTVGQKSISITAYFNGNRETVTPRMILYAAAAPETFGYRIISEYPHDENAYTQGLFFVGDTLIESTGDKATFRPESRSSIRKSIFETGRIIQSVPLEDRYFGEGCTMWNDRIIQLTWTSRIAFVYDRDLHQTGTLPYTTEGWGLTTYGDTLLLSDGTNIVYFLQPTDLSEFKRLEVYSNEAPVDQLNELEVVDGQLYANIYPEDRIVIIDLTTGEVTGEINFDGIVDRSTYRGTDYAMNGIAHHEEDRLFVTGKWWPSLFEIMIFPNKSS